MESLRRVRWGRCLAAAVLIPRLRTLLTCSRYAAIYWRHGCVLAVAVPLCPTLLCRRVADTAFRSRRYCTGVTGICSRTSVSVAVFTDVTVLRCCLYRYCQTCRCAVLLLLTPPCHCGGRYATLCLYVFHFILLIHAYVTTKAYTVW